MFYNLRTLRPMRKLGVIILGLTLLGCGSVKDYITKPFTDLFTSGDDAPAAGPTVTAQPVIEPTAKYALAMGGVAPGRDQLVLSGILGKTLIFIAADPIVGFMTLPDKATYIEGPGAQIVPQKEGKTTFHYTVDDVASTATYAITIPPQALIQILIGEARGQIASEVTLASGAVALTSRSITAEALASVIRNRVKLIDSESNPGLFDADPVKYNVGGDPAKYDAVIAATQAGTYQFSPVDPTDPSHDSFTNAEARSFLDASLFAAYDQSVLSAAGVFDGTIDDPTGGAFGFRTPDAAETLCMDLAAKTPSPVLPSSCDEPDARFPALAPIQILIHPKIPRLSDNRPAFIFYRTRAASEPAVSTRP